MKESLPVELREKLTRQIFFLPTHKTKQKMFTFYGLIPTDIIMVMTYYTLIIRRKCQHTPSFCSSAPREILIFFLLKKISSADFPRSFFTLDFLICDRNYSSAINRRHSFDSMNLNWICCIFFIFIQKKIMNLDSHEIDVYA